MTISVRAASRMSAVIGLCVVLVTACAPASPPSATGSPGAGVLAGACPATVVIQTDWEPEAEHGPVYALLGEDYTIDPRDKNVTGPLLDGGEPTGVDVQIRIGGASVGYQSSQALLYADKDILLDYGRVSEYLSTQSSLPVTGVLSGLEKSPYAIYWDPRTYPEVRSISDLKDEGVTVLAGATEDVWVSFLTGEGILDKSQIDRSDAPRPATFVAAEGKVAEAGYITAEPFTYEHEVEQWGRPVTGQLIHDTGYPEYFQSLIVRQEDVSARADCLRGLVPILQRAQVAYAQSPDRANDLIVEAVQTYRTGWVYSKPAADYSHRMQIERGLLANGHDGVMGSFDTRRVAGLVNIVTRHHDSQASRFSPDDLVTNAFVDSSVALRPE